MNKQIRAEDLVTDTWIVDDNRELYVIELASNRIGDVIVRCSYSGPMHYPCTSLLLRPDELVRIKD